MFSCKSNFLLQFNSCGKYSKTFSSCQILLKDKLELKLKGKKKSSQEWLKRQLSDPYVKWAKVEQYRCRSAFKLLEMNEKHRILSPGMFVVDCGAAPGSWTQVLVKECNSLGQDSTKPKGTVVAVDINNIVPIDGATIFEKHDFTLPETQQKIQVLMEQHGGAHAVVSDMAPLASGVKHLDHEVIVNLCYIALRFSMSISRPGATFLTKLWDGRLAPALQADIYKFYSNVKAVKPSASRSDSAEFFLLAKDFKGLKPR